MHKDLSSFKLYMSDVGLFVNKARYPLYQVDLSQQPVMIAMGPLTENYVANELRVKGYDLYTWFTIPLFFSHIIASPNILEVPPFAITLY